MNGIKIMAQVMLALFIQSVLLVAPSYADVPDSLEAPGILISSKLSPRGFLGGFLGGPQGGSQDGFLRGSEWNTKFTIEAPVRRLPNGVAFLGASLDQISLFRTDIKPTVLDGSVYVGASFFGPNGNRFKSSIGVFEGPTERGIRGQMEADYAFAFGDAEFTSVLEAGKLDLPPQLIAIAKPNNPNGPDLPSNAFRRVGFDTEITLNRLPFLIGNSYLKLLASLRAEQSFDPKVFADWGVEGRILTPSLVKDGFGTFEFASAGDTFGSSKFEGDAALPLYRTQKSELSAVGDGNWLQNDILQPSIWTAKGGLKLSLIPNPRLFTYVDGRVGRRSDQQTVLAGTLGARFRASFAELFAEAGIEQTALDRLYKGKVGASKSGKFGNLVSELGLERRHNRISGTTLPNRYFVKAEGELNLNAFVAKQNRTGIKLFVDTDLAVQNRQIFGAAEAGLRVLF